jgi:hypothetical protein
MTDDCHTLVFGSSGTLFYAYLGALEGLFTDCSIKKIKNFIGSSGGGLLATFLALGSNITELHEMILSSDLSLDIDKIMDGSNYSMKNLYNLINHYGANSGDALYESLCNMAKKITGKNDITFDQLYITTGKNLVLTGSNISQHKLFYFNRLTTPNMKIIDALRITICVPFFFRPIRYEDAYYIDGGATSPYPIDFIYTRTFKQINYDDIKKMDDDQILSGTIGFKIITDSSIQLFNDFANENTFQMEKKNIIDFFTKVFSLCNDSVLKYQLNNKNKNSTILINAKRFSNDDIIFNYSIEDKKELCDMGHKASIEFLSSHIACN